MHFRVFLKKNFSMKIGNKIVLLLCLFSSANGIFAKENGTVFSSGNEKLRQRVLANNASFQRESHLLDSVMSKYMESSKSKEELVSDAIQAEWNDSVGSEAFEAYEGNWDTSGVNANRVAVKDVPDSVLISCEGYVPPVKSYTTSRFGMRRYRYHYGIDLKVQIGDEILAAFDGKVRVTRFDRRGYGYYVVIRHSNGLETVYGHLSKIKVSPGQIVNAGDCIGLGGNTGRSTGPHLHFETRYLGNPINPEKLINFQTHEVLADNYLVVKKNSFDWYYNKSTGRPLRIHKVRSGETLSHIAKRYGVTINQICRKNGIRRNSTLRIGQRLRI